MRKAIATFGTGPAAQTLAVAMPTFRDYAQRHGYDLLTDVGDSRGRPLPWGKIPLLQDLLRRYDFVFWVDADAIIVDGSIDIECVVPADAYQGFALVEQSPCTGVWALRAGERTQSFLAEVWAQADLIDHHWWEQAAVTRLLGWELGVYPSLKERDTKWCPGAFLLDPEWDLVPKYAGRYRPARIRHYAAETTRRRLFDMGTDLAEFERRRVRQWAGEADRRARPVYRPWTGGKHQMRLRRALKQRARLAV